LAEKPAEGMGCTLGWQFPHIIRRVNGGWRFWFIYVKLGLVKVLISLNQEKSAKVMGYVKSFLNIILFTE